MIYGGKIPEHWEIKQLDEVGEIVSGGTPSTKEEDNWGDEIIWITPSDLTGYLAKTIHKGKKSISELGLSRSSARLMPKGSVLFSSRAPIGYVVIAGTELCTNQGFKSIIPNKKVISDYLFHFLKYSKTHVQSIASGTTFKEISARAFSSLKIPIPPLKEQHLITEKIEELFSELDAGSQLLETAKEQLKTYKQAVLKSAFEGRLTKKNTFKNVLPSAWRTVKLNEICKKIIGGGTPKTDNPKYWSGDIPWISSADIFGIRDIRPRRKITSEAVMDSATNILPRGGIIVVTRVGLGKVALAPYDICFSQDNQGLILNTELVIENYVIRYLMFAVQSFKAKSRGTTISGITKNHLRNLKFILPPKNDQIILIKEIESRISICEKLELTIEDAIIKTEDLKKSILKQAFEGTLVKPQTN